MSLDGWIEIEVSTFAQFKVSDLWPDGGAPEEITEEAVRELVDQVSPRRIINDWFFPTPDIHIHIFDRSNLQ